MKGISPPPPLQRWGNPYSCGERRATEAIPENQQSVRGPSVPPRVLDIQRAPCGVHLEHHHYLLKLHQLGECSVVLDVVPRAFVPRLLEKGAGRAISADGDETRRHVKAGFARLAPPLVLVDVRRRGHEGFAIQAAQQVLQDGRGPFAVLQLGDAL